MENKKTKDSSLLEWIAISAIGIMWSLLTYIAFYSRKLAPSMHIISIPFFIVGSILTICGILGLLYITITKKQLNRKIILGIVFETFGIFLLSGSIILFLTNKAFGSLFPAFISVMFIVEGIRIPLKFSQNEFNRNSALNNKKLYGYQGITATEWFFGYSWIMVGTATLVYASPVLFRIIGIVCIAFGLYCYIKKILFYLRYNKRKKG